MKRVIKTASLFRLMLLGMRRSLLATALCFALTDPVADWIELIPAGSLVKGVDGRSWVNDQPDAVIAAFTARNKPLVIDWEHATELRAPNGLEAPAAGWIDRLENRGSAIWGHVEWTAKAANQIKSKEYRFLSPVFLYEPDSQRIKVLTSVGLTNKPNLTLTALNHEESPVSLPVAVLTALGLAATADESAAMAAISALQNNLVAARNQAQTPSLDKFIPRADYDTALQRATNAEQKLAAIETERREAQIATLIEKALTEQKISPATKEYYTAMCRTADGIQQFETFLEKTTPLLGQASNLDGKKLPDGGTGTAMNAELQQVSAMFGNSAEDLRKFGGLN